MKLPRWELRCTADPLDTRVYGGGGGDGGAGDMRRQEEARQAKVQAAVDAINGKFGIAPAGAAAQPTRDQFTSTSTGGRWLESGASGEGEGSRTWVPEESKSFDEGGYNKALADWTAAQQAVGTNKQARDAMYTDIGSAVRDTALRDLDLKYSKAGRNNVFGLARSGLLGGSVDAESGAELQRLYGEGRISAEQQGIGASADLRNQDEGTRQRLIQLAQSGLDTGTAASLAEGQMSSAAQLAKSQAHAATVGNLFDDLGQAYLTNRVLAARYPNGLPQVYSGGNVYASKNFTPGTAGGRVQ